MSTEFVTVAKVGEIPDGEGRAFEVNDQIIAVFNNSEEYIAIDDMCPHMGASLAAGYFDKSDWTVSCPWHAWRFDTRDGSWCDNRRLRVDVFAVRVNGNEIQVSKEKLELPDDTQEPSKPASDCNPTDKPGEDVHGG